MIADLGWGGLFFGSEHARLSQKPVCRPFRGEMIRVSMPSVLVPVAEFALSPTTFGGGAPAGEKQGRAGQGGSLKRLTASGVKHGLLQRPIRNDGWARSPACRSQSQPLSAATVSNHFFTLVRRVGAASSRSPINAQVLLFAGLAPATGRSARFCLATAVWGRISPPAVASTLDVSWSRSLRVRPAIHCTACGGLGSHRAAAGCLAPRPARRVKQPRLVRTQLAESSFYEKRNADQCLAARGMPHRHR